MAASLSARLLGAAGLTGVGAVAIALVSQHVYGMEPCPWCVLQRVIFLALSLACLLGLLWRSPLGRRVGAGLGLILAGCGIAAAWWQHTVASAQSTCNLTLADRIMSRLQLDSLAPDVFSARASCMDAAVDLFGLRYELWSLALFLLLALVLLRVLLRPTA